MIHANEISRCSVQLVNVAQTCLRNIVVFGIEEMQFKSWPI